MIDDFLVNYVIGAYRNNCVFMNGLSEAYVFGLLGKDPLSISQILIHYFIKNEVLMKESLKLNPGENEKLALYALNNIDNILFINQGILSDKDNFELVIINSKAVSECLDETLKNIKSRASQYFI